MFTTFKTIDYNGVTFKLKGSECTKKQWCTHTKGAPYNDNSHTIKLSVVGLDTWTSFEYWTSVSQGPNMTNDDLVWAFYCFVDDAVAGDYSFDEFVDEFGYTDPKQAYHTWKACQNAKNKLRRIYDGDLCELGIFLQENYDC